MCNTVTLQQACFPVIGTGTYHYSSADQDLDVECTIQTQSQLLKTISGHFLINALSPSSQFANHVHTAGVIITLAIILGEHRQTCSSLKHVMSATASYTTVRKSDSRRHESEEDEWFC